MIPRRAQQGAALVISLLLLIALTLVGVAAMNTSLLELMMAGNNQHHTEALLRAETSLRDAEGHVEQLVADNHGFDQSDTPPAAQIATDAAWGPVLAAGNHQSSNAESTGYAVQYIGCRPLPGEPMNSCQGSPAGSYLHLYRINAFAENGKGTERTLQTNYGTLAPP